MSRHPLWVLDEGLEALSIDLVTFPEESLREKVIDMTRGLSKKGLEAIIAILQRSGAPER